MTLFVRKLKVQPALVLNFFRKVKSLFVTSIALFFGAIGTYFVAQYLGLVGISNTQSEIKLVVASSSINPGELIQSTQVRLVSWPTLAVPKSSFTDLSLVTGRIAKQTIHVGEVLLEPKLASIDAKGGLSSTIETGKRAISVRVNDVVGVAGFALPGSYVDVLVSAKDAASAAFSTTVLNRVKVLAVAQETQTDQMKPKVVNAVTLELTPPEAEKLDLARSIGTLSLVLRNENDTTDVNSAGTRLNDILRSGKPAPAPAAAKVNTGPPAAPRPARPPSNEIDTVTSIRGIAKREEQP